ncbi:MAG TPA: MFS transporter [Thermoplasmata archaeon]|nr:MFS transporter [Thermoplasmata archaeon]
MGSPEGASRPSFGRALRSRPFFLLWLSQLISQSGDFVFEVALLWLVLEVTGSVFAVGLVVAVTLLPSVLLGPFLGVFVDRWDRRRMLIVTNVAEGVALAALSGLLLAHTINLTLILVVAFFLGTGSQVVRTASTAVIPQLVEREDLPPANSLMSFSNSFNQIVGLSVGGVVVALLGVTIPIEYDALSFFLAAVIVGAIAAVYGRPKDAGSGAPTRFSEEFAEGIRFIRENRFLMELILLGAAVNFFGNAIGALFAPYTKLVLHGGPAIYGFLGAAIAFGAIVGALVIGKIETRKTSGKYLFGGGVATGAMIAALGLTSTIPVAFAVVLLLGVALSVTNIPISVLIQAKVPGRLLGRVLAAFGSLITIAGPAGAFFAGAFAAATSVSTVYLVSGGVILGVLGLGFVVMGDLRDISY